AVLGERHTLSLVHPRLRFYRSGRSAPTNVDRRRPNATLWAPGGRGWMAAACSSEREERVRMRASRRWLLVLAAALLPLALASPAAAAPVSPAEPGAPLTAADIARLSADASKRSIIVFRNQHPELPARGAAAATRAAAVDSDQRAVKGELSQLHAGARSLHTVNAVAATISQAEADRLTADPAVQAVVPDRFIARPAPPADVAAQAPAPAGAASAAPAAQLQQVCPS